MIRNLTSFNCISHWQFYKRCKRWKVEVDKNPEAYKERDNFVKSELVEKMVKQVSDKVGVDLNFCEF